jgi:hypothetical protein
MHEICESILSELKAKKDSGLKVVLILDLDSCLVSVSPRTFQIFKEFASSSELEEYSQDIDEFKTVVQSWENFEEVYYPREFLKHNTGFEMNEDLYEVFLKYWRERFFSNEYLKYDFPYPGALEFSKAALNSYIPIVYLTGRPQEFMKPGTYEQLKILGFPDPESTENVGLIMKSGIQTNDIEFKFDSLKKLNDSVDYGIFIDNENPNLKFCLEKESKIKGYIFDSVHSGRSIGDLFPKLPSW